MRTILFNFFSGKKYSKGFTLIETLVTTSILSLLFGACLMILLSGSDSWQVNNARVQMHQELRKAADWMKEDLIEGGISTITNVPADGNSYTTITFKTSNGISGGNIVWSTDTIQFLLGGTNNNELQRKSGSTTKVLAQNIKSLQFKRQASTPSVVEISLQAEKNTFRGIVVTVNMNSKVQMRN